MFRIITGSPGSGKSFYAVNYLKNFVTHDRLYDEMLLDKSVLLITNIDEIKVSHMHVDEFFKLDLFDQDRFKKYLNHYSYKRAVMIVDEAQHYFSGCKDEKKIFFFEYHRHLGLDIFFVQTSVAALPKRLVECAEYIIDAMPRSYSVGGFRYEVKDVKTGQRLYSKGLKKNQAIFKLYKSFDVDELEKPKKVLLTRYFIGFAIIVIALGLAIKILGSGLGLKNMGTKKVHAVQVEQIIDAPGPEMIKDNVSILDNISEQSDTKLSKREKLLQEYGPYFLKYPANAYKDVKVRGIVRGWLEDGTKTYVLYDDNPE